MSAAPKPEPDPQPEPADVEGWALLEGLRRRLDDQAVQGRKTQQQVTQLAESIGALVDVQRRRSRWLNLNSFVAYLIFTLLCGAGFYFLYTSRASELVAARDTAKRERDTAVRRADEATAKLAAREQAETRAWEVYELLEAGKRADAVAKLAALDNLPLSKTERSVLAARAHETQVMEVDAALKASATAFKNGRHAEVIPQLEAALVGEPAGPRASSMRYYLGVAYAKSAQLDKAIANLTTALAVEAEHEDVRFQLASALDRSGAWGKARVEYDRFATAHPVSSFAAFAMRRSATLARMPAQAPAKPKDDLVAPGSLTPAAPPAPNTAKPSTGDLITPGSLTPPAPAAKQPVWKPKAPVKPTPKPVAPSTDSPAPASPLPPAQPGSGVSLTTPQWNNVPSPMIHLPIDASSDKPAKPSNSPANKPTNKQAEKPGDKPADKPGDKPADKPADKTADRDKANRDKPDRDKTDRDKSDRDKTADRDKPRDPLPPSADPPSALPTPAPERWPSNPPPPDRAPPPEVAVPKRPPPPSAPPVERVASE